MHPHSPTTFSVWPVACNLSAPHVRRAGGGDAGSAAGRGDEKRSTDNQDAGSAADGAAMTSDEGRIEGAGLAANIRYALDALVQLTERHSREFRASVLLVSSDGRLLDCAGPRLPLEYRRAIHGQKIGEGMGSCGTAAFRGERVIVGDIARDPLWADFRDIALANGLRACWSQPIRSSTGEVLGTFAQYYDEPRLPDAEEIRLIETAAARAAVMLEQARRGASAEALVEELRSV